MGGSLLSGSFIAATADAGREAGVAWGAACLGCQVQDSSRAGARHAMQMQRCAAGREGKDRREADVCVRACLPALLPVRRGDVCS